MKKTLTKISIGTFFLLGGIEYAVILPSLWLYVSETFGAEPWFFGVIFSSFMFSSLFSGPLFGLWVDCTGKTKSTILFANLFEIGGNFLYFIAWSKYWVLGARLICGVGAGVGSAINAQIARTTTPKERTAMFSMAMGLRQVGLLIGPGFNLFLKECNFSIGPFHVDAYRSPGIFMVLVWVLQEIFMLFAYYNLEGVPDVNQPDAVEKSEKSSGVMTSEAQEKPLLVNESLDDTAIDKQISGYGNYSERDTNNSVISSDSFSTHSKMGEVVGSPSRSHIRRSRTSTSSAAKLVETLKVGKDFVREELIVILSSHFLLFFNESALEALMTPMCKKLLGWGQLENSVTFCLIALEAIFVFFLVGKLSKKLSDRWMIVIGAVFEGLALVLYIIVLAPVKPLQDLNGDCVKAVHGSRDICNQIIRSFFARKKLEREQISLPLESKARQFVLKMGSCHRLPKKLQQVQYCDLVGNKAKFAVPPAVLAEITHANGVTSATDLRKLLRIVKDREVYCSEEYKRMKKRINHAVLFNHGPDSKQLIGLIKYLIHPQ